MTEEIGLVLVAVVFLAALGGWLWRRRLAQSGPVCEDCTYFSLEAGQQALTHSGAFAGAAAVLPPWRMAEKRRIDWSPEYVALEKELEAAIKARDYKKKTEIHARIQELGELGKEIPPEKYVDEGLLELAWSDFGECRKHRELRARVDHCDRFQRRRRNQSHRQLTVLR